MEHLLNREEPHSGAVLSNTSVPSIYAVGAEEMELSEVNSVKGTNNTEKVSSVVSISQICKRLIIVWEIASGIFPPGLEV